MRERSILMTAFELRAIRAGQKTMVRRVVEGVPAEFMHGDVAAITDGERWAISKWSIGGGGAWPADPAPGLLCPYGATGDRLLATLAGPGVLPGQDPHQEHRPGEDAPEHLEVTSQRVERLHEISAEDADAEGIYFEACCMCGEYLEPHGGEWTGNYHSPTPMGTPHELYAELWDSVYGDGSFASNPWVWVVSFKRVEVPRG